MFKLLARLGLALVAFLLLAGAGAAGASFTQAPTSPLSAGTTSSSSPPPIRHVWVIVLENENEGSTFGVPGSKGSDAPYLTQVLPSEGTLLPNYYGVGHASLDNYVAMISGQAPNPQNQLDCAEAYDPFVAVGMDVNDQVVGQGCEFPTTDPEGQPILTVADQLTEAGYTWKSYEQSMGRDLANDGATACAHPTTDEPSGGLPNPQGEDGSSNYAVKHDPFMYFDSIISDNASCASHVVPVDPNLQQDLTSVATTPNFSFITPDLVWDGHDTKPQVSDLFLEKYVPMILASPAFRQDGMLVVTYDESGSDDTSCCGEIPGPNSPGPGEEPVTTSGLGGGGDVGAVVLSPFAHPGTVDDTDYNHYSLLRTVESVFGLSYLGFAGTYADYAGPGQFGCDVFTAYGPCLSTTQPGPSPVPNPSDSGTGPRPADGRSSWIGPGGVPDDLNAVSCPDASDCLAVGAAGAIETSADGGRSWSDLASPTVNSLQGTACPTSASCVAVGDTGAVLDLTKSATGWSARMTASPTSDDLEAVSCPSAQECVAVGDGVIIRSTDGGASWSTATANLPPLDPGSTDDLLDVACPTVADCFAVGSLFNTEPSQAAAEAARCNGLSQGQVGSCEQAPTTTSASPENVYASTNGGSGWTAESATDSLESPRLRSITCTGASDCVAVGESGALLTTADGTTWNDQTSLVPATPVPGNTAELMSARDLLQGVACPTAAACVGVGTRPEFGDEISTFAPAGLDQVQATVLGLHLSSYSATSGDSATLKEPGVLDGLASVACPDASECVAVGQRGTIVRNQGPGTSWTRVTGSVDESLYGVSCPSSTSCMAVGGSSPLIGMPEGGGALSRTSTGAWVGQTIPAAAEPASVAGETDPLPPPTTAGAWYDAVSCTGPQSCVAVGLAGTIARLTSSGWQSTLVDPLGSPPAGPQGSVPTEDLQAVSCVKGGDCVAVGSGGSVLASANGGQSWTIVASATSSDLDAVSCATSGECLAVGGFGAALVVSHAGGTWRTTSVSSGSDALLTAVSCPSAAVCVAVGSASTVVGFSAGTGSWHASPESSGVGDQLNGVDCSTTTECVAVGSAGTVIETVDGGKQWTVHGTGSGDDLRAVSCPTKALCVAVGDAGGIVSFEP